MKLLITVILFYSSWAMACPVFNSQGIEIPPQGDALSQLLVGQACPQNVQSLKDLMASQGLATRSSMVANRGIHNPSFGSFSIFEEVFGISGSLGIGQGEFFFGHFTKSESGWLVLDQRPDQGKLMIEVIVWDSIKGFYNFYELIGAGAGAVWFYRGDSADVLADNQWLHRNGSSGGQKFGKRMRCSACHTSGGPIMKELRLPHNDWMTAARPLGFSPNQPSMELTKSLANLVDAGDLAYSVEVGMGLLNNSQSYQKLKNSLSLQEILRPLFCTTEINLESDYYPLSSGQRTIALPGASLIDPFLARGDVPASKDLYLQSLTLYGMSFPESGGIDADHAWLTPVKGKSDLLAVQSLVGHGIISEEFLFDVLAVDFKNPVFSQDRCHLLQWVPNWSMNWVSQFVENLKSLGTPSANELLVYLLNPEMTKDYHLQRAQNYQSQILTNIENPQVFNEAFSLLLNNRNQVFQNEISQNPLGQILEPGFRVIFPHPNP